MISSVPSLIYFFFFLFFPPFPLTWKTVIRKHGPWHSLIKKEPVFSLRFGFLFLSPAPCESTGSATCWFVRSCPQVILLVPREKIQNNSMQSIYSTWQFNSPHIFTVQSLLCITASSIAKYKYNMASVCKFIIHREDTNRCFEASFQ